MLSPPMDNVCPQKRSARKRKNLAPNMHPSGAGSKKKGFPQQSDVMMVGEPTLMPCDFGEEDDHMITQLENNQFVNSVHIKSEDHDGAANFPNIPPSPSTPQQWQQETNQINQNIVKNEIRPSDTIANSPHVITS